MDELILGGACTLHRIIVCFSVSSRMSWIMESGCGRIMGLASVEA